MGRIVYLDEEISLRQCMLKKCKKAVLLCDKTKLNQTSFAHVCEISEIDYFVTNEKPDDSWLEVFKNAGVKVIYPSYATVR